MYIEVKGLNAQSGGILLTDKEWDTAKKYRNKYYLILFKNIGTDTIEEVIIKNPFAVLMPKKVISTVVQVNWHVSEKDMKTLN